MNATNYKQKSNEKLINSINFKNVIVDKYNWNLKYTNNNSS